VTPEGNVLALVARYPRPGTVKTRLAAVIGPPAVYALYSAFLRDLAERLSGGPWQLHWLYTPAGDPFAAWLGTGQAVSPQHGASLNDRLRNGFRALCRGYARVIIMSTDSPQVSPDWIAAGFTLLDHRDVVLGPCADGGYYLIGMRAPHDVFSGIVMSTPTVLTETVSKARQQGLSTALLPSTFDVDDSSGLTALATWLDHRTSGELPRTRALLAGLGLPVAPVSVPTRPCADPAVSPAVHRPSTHESG
jgi:uncharacterized protein